MSIKNDIEENIEALKQQRDELRLKIHLANMEAQDEWEELEEKWQELMTKPRQLKKDLDPTLDDINISYHLLADELKNGYEKLRKAL